MKKTFLLFAGLSLAIGSTLSLPASAADAPAAVTCKDGTAGTAGKGACSHHGGVDKKAAKAAATTAAPGATPAVPAAAAVAGIKCKDGTASKSKTTKGACSHHGGVATS